MNFKSIYYRVISILFVILILGGMLLNGIVPRGLKKYIEGNDIMAIIGAEEADIADNFWRKDYFVTINGLIHRVFAQRYMNEVVLLDNGHGSMLMPDCSDEILMSNAVKVKEFSDWCTNNGRTFTYAQMPYKNEEGNAKLPIGMEDYSNSVADRFGTYLVDLDVDYIDIRESLKNSDEDYYSYFYKTEHHWNSYGGFFAFNQIASHMQDKYGDVIDPDVLDLKNYECTVYEKMHSGYYGSRVGTVFIPPEDFYLLYPSFNTIQTCIIPHRDLVRSGSFYEAVFEQDFLYDETIHGMYGTYIGGDYPLVIHESETAATDKCIVMFIDSFGTIPESFLTTAYKKVVAVDLRWVLRNGWEETAVEYVDEYDADHVIVMFNPNQLIYEDTEQFEFGIE